jgi:hypothetical protein
MGISNGSDVSCDKFPFALTSQCGIQPLLAIIEDVFGNLIAILDDTTPIEQ